MKQQFTVGANIMAREKENKQGKWAECTVYATRLVAPDGNPWRPDRYSVEEAVMGYTVFNEASELRYGNFGVEINELTHFIAAAGRNPYRPCWDGDVEITELHELQLFLHDFDLDGTDTDIIAQANAGRLSGTLGTDHDQHARLLIEPRSGSRISINVLRLMHLPVQTR